MTTCGAEPDAVDKETAKEKGRYVLALPLVPRTQHQKANRRIALKSEHVCNSGSNSMSYV